jgi:hypothetical protein
VAKNGIFACLVMFCVLYPKSNIYYDMMIMTKKGGGEKKYTNSKHKKKYANSERME